MKDITDMRNFEEFNSKYANKICFVLGSGASMNFQNLSILDGHLVIAVNSGWLAYPKAQFFVSDDEEFMVWTYARDLKKSDTTVLLYDKKLLHAAPQFGDKAVIFRHRKGYHITDKYVHEDPELHVCQARTSVGSAIHMAHIMGCSAIGLLGIDCCRIENQRYFWQFWKNKPKRLDGKPNDKFKKTSFQGQQSDTDLIEILDYWKNFGHEINLKCKVYNLSPVSILDIFPKMELETFSQIQNKDFI